MRQLATVIRVLAEINEQILDQNTSGDLSKQKALVSSHLHKLDLSSELTILIRSIAEKLFELEETQFSESGLTLDGGFRVYFNRVHQRDMSESELRIWLLEKKPETFDILIKEGDPNVRFGHEVLAMKSTDTIKYRVLVSLLREQEPSISFERLHELIGSPFVNEITSAGIRSKMGDNLKKILDKLPIRKLSGARDWWKIEKRRISLNPTLKTCLISAVTSVARNRMLQHILAKEPNTLS